MKFPATSNITLDIPIPKEFSFDDFFKCSSGTLSPMQDLQRVDYSIRDWHDQSRTMDQEQTSETHAKKTLNREFLGKRSSGSLHADSQYESTDCAEIDSIKSGHPSKLAMVRLLMKSLVHERIEMHDIDAFGYRDLEILKSIVKRKYRVDIGNGGFDDKKKLLAELNSLDEDKRTEKRSEENNKLMFKRAIKYLIVWYKKNRWQDMKELRKKQYETMICKEFFTDIQLPECCKTKQFEDSSENGRRTSSRKKAASKVTSQADQAAAKTDEILRKFVINPNTINAKYIKYVFQSNSFKDFFDDFVANHFIADYRKNRGSKIIKIIDTVYTPISISASSKDEIQGVKTYIEKNPKFKLPWTDRELEQCTESTLQFILRVFRSRAAKPFADRKSLP